MTDGMKRAFRSFGGQFGNSLYGDHQQSVNVPKPERVPAQAQPKGGSDSQAETLRKRLIEIALEQGFDDDGLRSAVVNRMGKSIDDLTADELGPLVEAAANKLRQMRQAQAA